MSVKPYTLSFPSFFFARETLARCSQLISNGAQVQRRRHGCICRSSGDLRSAPQAYSRQFNGKWVSYTHTAMAYGVS